MLAVALVVSAATGSARAEPASFAPKAKKQSDGDEKKADTKGDDKDGDEKDGDDAKGKDDAEKREGEVTTDDGDFATGVSACQALKERNEREFSVWESRSKQSADMVPSEQTILTPWTEFGKHEGGHQLTLLTSTLIPHLNVALRDAKPVPGLSWVWSFPFGKPMSCSRKSGTFFVDNTYPFRALLEPGLLIDDRTVSLFLRPGARFVYQGATSPIGFGGGIGTMLELTGREPFRASVSPELLVRIGRCCEPGYVMLTARKEFFFAGRSDLWVFTAGFVYY